MALLALLSPLACGGDDGGAAPAADAGAAEEDASTESDVPLTVDDLCGPDGAYATFVTSALTCAPELVELLGIELDGSDLDAACDALFAPYVEDGTIELGSRDDLEVCLAALEALDCTTEDIRTIDACDPVVLGTIAEGGDCEVDSQCAGDAYCDPVSATGCGTCRPLEDDGASCEDDDECAGGRCAAGMCRQVSVAGESCEVDDDCAGTLRCDPEDLLCEIPPPWAVGDPCVPDTSDCGFPTTDLFCDQGTQMCAAFADLGDACAGGAAVCNFLEYEICDAGTGLCTAPRTAPLGGPCGFFAGRKCQAGLSCSQPFTGGTCVDPAVGSTCDAAVDDLACGFLLECQADNTCQFATSYTGTCP